MRRVAFALALTFLVGYTLAEDKITLRDGQVLAGKILSETETEIQIQTSDDRMMVPTWAIDTVEQDGKIRKLQKPEATAPTTANRPTGSAADRATATATPAATAKTAEKTEASSKPRTDKSGVSPELEKWVDVCIEKLGAGDDLVRRGASLALRAAGTAAHPALEKAALGDDKEVAELARKLLGRSDRTPRPTDRRTQRRIDEEGRRIEKREQKYRAGVINKLTDDLELDEEQTKQVSEIFVTFHEQQKSVLQQSREGAVPRRDAGKKLEELRRSVDEKVAEVLNDEQKMRYEALMSKGDARKREGE